MIFFSHIPKSGGTTNRAVISHNIGRDNCLFMFPKEFGGDFDVEETPNLNPDLIYNANAIIGHISVSTAMSNCTLSKLNSANKLLILSAIRDPIDRIISDFNFSRTVRIHPDHSKLIDEGFDGFINYCKDYPSNQHFDMLKTTESDSVDDIINSVVLFSLPDAVRGFSEGLSFISEKPQIEYDREQVTTNLPDEVDVEHDVVLYKKSDLPKNVINELLIKHSLDYELYEKTLCAYDNSIAKIKAWADENIDIVNSIKNGNTK